MNLRFVVKQFGLLLLILSAVLVVLAGTFFIIEAIMKKEVSPAARMALFLSGLIGAVVGGLLWWLSRRAPGHLGRREALLLVGVTWLLGATFAALPFFIWAHLAGTDAADDHPFKSVINCYFEGMSGLTTTGATILSDIETVPRSLLLWRAFTQWLGGLGIVVLFVAVLPTLGVGGKRLFQVEAPGPAPEGLQPQIRQTARVLLLIYLALTAAEILALWATPMSFYEAVCHTFTTIATAGFSTQNASIGAYDSVAIHVIVIAFMVLSGVNFGLYFALIRGKYENVLRDPELRTYIVLLLAGSLIVFVSLIGHSITTTTGEELSPSAGEALRYGVFTSVALGTTTGYSTADFDTWPFLAKAVLIMLMFAGGSAGSTAGGIKVIRVWVAFKVMLAEIEHVFRPHVVRPVRVGRAIVDDQLKLGTISYILGIIILFALGSVVVMSLEQLNPAGGCDYATAASASFASLCNIGPGFAQIGAVENYGWMTPYSKVVLSLLMALGRLEIFALIVLLTPRFWWGD